MKNTIILASGSPRRRELLLQIGITPIVRPSSVEEVVTETEPARIVESLSAQKCSDVANHLVPEEDLMVLGADTIVAMDGKILGKPKDEADAYAMLSSLSGRSHQVYTGVTLMKKSRGQWIRDTFSVATEVHVTELSDREIRDYIASGEPMDKAGAYGIQGLFGKFIPSIEGDYSNVVGLPLAAVYEHMKVLEETERYLSYTIRPVRDEDLDAVTEVEAACFPAAEAAGRKDFAERIESCRRSFFVAEDEQGRIVGFCNGCCADADILVDEMYHETALHDPEGAHQMIFGLDVIPSCRRQGLGEALMLHMLQSAKKRGKKAAILTCKDHMIHFYEKCGYELQGLSESTHGGASWSQMICRLNEN